MSHAPSPTPDSVEEFTWNDDYLLGYDPMDDTHREFVDHYNRLLQVTGEALLAELDAFIAHTVDHFDQENRWMEQVDFPACHKAEHDRVLAVVADVRDEASVKDLFAVILGRFGRLDFLFNNAGIFTAGVPLEDLPLADWQAAVDVNLTGAFLCTREAFRLMKAQAPRGGRSPGGVAGAATDAAAMLMRHPPIAARSPPRARRRGAAAPGCAGPGSGWCRCGHSRATGTARPCGSRSPSSPPAGAMPSRATPAAATRRARSPSHRRSASFRAARPWWPWTTATCSSSRARPWWRGRTEFSPCTRFLEIMTVCPWFYSQVILVLPKAIQ